MIEHNKNFYSLEELKRTRDNLEGYLDNEEVYYFVGAIRYACDEIERLNNIINELEKWLDKKEKLTFNSWNKGIHEVQRKLQELKGVDKE